MIAGMDYEYPWCGTYLSYLRNLFHTDGRLLPRECVFCRMIARALRKAPERALRKAPYVDPSLRGPGDLLDRGPDGEWFVHIKPAQSR